jgi:hypothetical protein
MRGRVAGGVVKLEEELPDGTEVEVTPVPSSGPFDVDAHLRAIEAEGGVVLAGPRTPDRRLRPIVHAPGGLRQFLEERR